jgi:transposase InsO family protein
LLDQMFEEMPFPVQRVQTDRGTEFFAEAVQRRLMAWSVKFRPILPRSPHLNGKIERAQRTVLEEFWATVDARAPDIADQLSQWVHHYNWHRPHEGLGGLSPIDRVCDRASKTPIWAEVADAYDATKERVQIREHAVEMALRKLK